MRQTLAFQTYNHLFSRAAVFEYLKVSISTAYGMAGSPLSSQGSPKISKGSRRLHHTGSYPSIPAPVSTQHVDIHPHVSSYSHAPFTQDCDVHQTSLPLNVSEQSSAVSQVDDRTTGCLVFPVVEILHATKTIANTVRIAIIRVFVSIRPPGFMDI